MIVSALRHPNSFFRVAAYLATFSAGRVAVPLRDHRHTRRGTSVKRSGSERAGVFHGSSPSRYGLAMRLSQMAPRSTGVAQQSRLDDAPGLGRQADSRRRRRRRPPIHVGHDPGPGGPVTATATCWPTLRPSSSTSGSQPRRPDAGRAAVLLLLRRLPAAHAPRRRRQPVLVRHATFPGAVIEAIGNDQCTGYAGVPSSYQQLLRASSFEPCAALLAPPAAGGRKVAERASRGRRCSATHPAVPDVRPDGGHRAAGVPPAGDAASGVVAPSARHSRASPSRSRRERERRGARDRRRDPRRGANITLGYWRDPSAPQRSIDGGLLYRGLGTVDEDGFLFVVDRAPTSSSRGARVSSHEIEDAVLDIHDTVVRGRRRRPGRLAGEAVVLFAIRATASCGGGRSGRYSAAGSPSTCCPGGQDPADLPLNANGKVVKSVLRDLARSATRSRRLAEEVSSEQSWRPCRAGKRCGGRTRRDPCWRAPTLQSSGGAVRRASPPATELETVAALTVFFGHKSVGDNILDAMPGLYEDAGVAAPQVVESDGPVPPGPAIVHTAIGATVTPWARSPSSTGSCEEGWPICRRGDPQALLRRPQ